LLAVHGKDGKVLQAKLRSITVASLMLLCALAVASPSQSGEAPPDEIIADGFHRLGGLLRSPEPGPNMKLVPPGSIYAQAPKPLPAAVNNSAGMPPIGDQDGEGSCTAWGIGYYHTTQNEWMERGFDPSDLANQASPAYLYNVANGGEDGGSFMEDVANLLIYGGAPSMADFPYVNGDHVSWPSEDWMYTAGMHRKALSQNWIDLNQPGGFADARARLSMGYTLTTGIYVWSNFDYIENFKYVYCSSQRYGNNRGGHVVCIVGYDDDLQTADGPGAFRMVNSWGTGWGQQGWWWLSYQAAVDPSIDPGNVMYLESAVNYTPSLVARVGIVHPYRGDIIKSGGLQITLTVSGSTAWSRSCFSPLFMESYAWDTYQKHPFPGGKISFDASEAMSSMSPWGNNLFSADIYNNGDVDGKLTSFEILCPAWWCGNYSASLPAGLPPYTLTASQAPVRRVAFKHLPIRVDGDEDLGHQAVGEFWAGDGTLVAPYRMHDYDVNGSVEEYCIYVGNTTQFVNISRCFLHDSIENCVEWHNAKNGCVCATTMRRDNMCVSVPDSNNISISGCSMVDSENGIWAYGSRDVLVTQNVFTNNEESITLYQTPNVIIEGNDITSTFNGIFLFGQNNNTLIKDNTVTLASEQPIAAYRSTNITITGNEIFQNGEEGIEIYSCISTYLEGNIIDKRGIALTGDRLENWNTHTITSTNRLHGIPIRYYNNQQDAIVPANTSQVIIANCTRVTCRNLDLENCSKGISLGFSRSVEMSDICFRNNNDDYWIGHSNNNTINNSSASFNKCGLFLCYSDSNVISNSSFTSSEWNAVELQYSNYNVILNSVINNNPGIGLSISYSSANRVYHNRFINNTIQARNWQCANIWDNGYPSGGNYWDDYGDIDAMNGAGQDVPGPDGIGDTPYAGIIGGSGAADHYPLMSPWVEPVGTFFRIPVVLGWNLISFPGIPSSTALPSPLIDQNRDTTWDRALHYNLFDPADMWQQYNSAWPTAMNDLSSADNAMGIWLNVTSLGDGFINISGTLPTSTTIALRAGWNLVGYPSLDTATTVGVAFWGTGADIVEAFDPAAPYRTRVVGPSYVMRPGEGYWVHVVADSVWVVDW
jgi:parallel beta-helix repeat protein